MPLPHDRVRRERHRLGRVVSRVVIPAKPKAVRNVHKDGHDVTSDGIRIEDHAWCHFGDSRQVVDGSLSSQCFRDCVGITSGELSASYKGYAIVYKLRPAKR